MSEKINQENRAPISMVYPIIKSIEREHMASGNTSQMRDHQVVVMHVYGWRARDYDREARRYEKTEKHAKSGTRIFTATGLPTTLGGSPWSFGTRR